MVAAPKNFPWRGECGIKTQLLNPVQLGHRWLGLCGFSGKVTARKDVKMLCFAPAGNGELWGGIELGMVWDGWRMGELWLAGCHLEHFSCPVSCQLVDEGSQQSRLAVGFTGVFAGGSAPRNSHLFPPEHLSRLGFPCSSGKVHLLSLRPCCWPQPCLLCRLSFQQSSYWKMENTELLFETQLHFFSFFFLFYFPLLGAAEPPWLVYAWPCILLLGMLKIPAQIFPFHIPKYINVLLLWLVISSSFVTFATG